MKAGEDETVLIEIDTEPEYMPVRTAKKCYYEYYDLMEFFISWDRGDFVLTKKEYLELPSKLMDARRLYRQFGITQKMKQEKTHGG